MDQSMFSAACSGDVNKLLQLLQENPFILSDYTLMNNSSTENPLTIATKANHPAFVHEILKVNPQLAMEVNQDGVHPLDIASAYGNLEIVKEILATVGPEICRQPGRDGMSAIHYAVMNGRVEIIDKLISACSDSVKDVTSFGETALHLAVKCFKFEALRSMLQWLEKVDGTKGVVNWGDKEGNTALHYAVSRKQIESLELLFDWNNRTGNTLELNSVNKKGLTATDIADILIEYCSSDAQRMREILRRNGGSPSSSDQIDIVSERPQQVASESKQPTNDDRDHGRLIPKEKPKKFSEILELFKFKWERGSIGEARSTLLIVAALIATVTFQAGINPPTLLFDKSSNPSSGAIITFLIVNTVAFSASASIIEYLTGGFPFHKELALALFFMGAAYGCSIGNTRLIGTTEIYILFFSLFVPQLIRWGPILMKKIASQTRRYCNN